MKESIKKHLILALFWISIGGNFLLAQSSIVTHTSTLSETENSVFPDTQPEEVGVSSKNLERLSQEVKSWVTDNFIVGGELLIIKNNKKILHEAYGWADKEKNLILERNAIYNGGSMAKPYTNTAALMLIDRGEMDLYDPVSKFIPDFPDDETLISHLLTHTSGYGFESDKDIIYPIPDTIQTREHWVNMMMKRPKVYKMGTYNYTNFSQYLLSRVVDIIAGVSAEEFIQKELLDPLGANETYLYLYPDNSWSQKIPKMYTKNRDSKEFDLIWDNTMKGWTPFFTGASDVFLTATDFAKLLSVWANNGKVGNQQLFSEETAKKALKRSPESDDGQYGYNWFVKEMDGELFSFGHGGIWGTYGYYFQKSNTYVLFFTQTYLSQAEKNALWSGLINRLNLWEVLDGPMYNLIPIGKDEVIELKLNLLEQQKYVGTYEVLTPKGDTLQIQIGPGNDKLIMQDIHVDKIADNWQHLTYIGEHEFVPGYFRKEQLAFSRVKNMKIKFIIEKNIASSLEISINGNVISIGKRTE